MKRLTDQLKQAVEALAFADIGERSGRRAMQDALNGERAMHPPPGAPARSPRMIALGVGDYLPPAVMTYVLGACRRMGTDLLLITRDAMAARYLLSPYLDELAGIRCETEELPDTTRGAVLRVLSRRHEVLFAVSGTNDDPVAGLVGGRRGLLSGKSPVPVVVVSPEQRNSRPAPVAPQLAAAR